MENQFFDKKSLLKILKKDSDGNYKFSESAKDLAKDCVSFANSKGGIILIGIEDEEDLPPKDQIINDLDLPNKLTKRIAELTQNVFTKSEIKKYSNGGETIELRVYPSESTIASTNDGRYYIRREVRC